MVKTSKGETPKRKHHLEDEFGKLDANKALKIYERLSKTCISQLKENKPQVEKKTKATCYLEANNQNPAQK